MVFNKQFLNSGKRQNIKILSIWKSRNVLCMEGDIFGFEDLSALNLHIRRSTIMCSTPAWQMQLQ